MTTSPDPFTIAAVARSAAKEAARQAVREVLAGMRDNVAMMARLELDNIGSTMNSIGKGTPLTTVVDRLVRQFDSTVTTLKIIEKITAQPEER